LILYRIWLYPLLTLEAEVRKRQVYFSPEEIVGITEGLSRFPELIEFWLEDLPLSQQEIQSDIEDVASNEPAIPIVKVDQCDGVNASSQAESQVLASDIEGRICGDDEDWFSIERNVVVSMRFPAGDAIQIEAFDLSGKLIAGGSVQPYESFLTFPCPDEGCERGEATHLRVSSTGATGNSHLLYVERMDETTIGE